MNLIDDTWYIVDDYAILMLCKTTEQDCYKVLMSKLKGNGDSLKDAIKLLEKMEQDVGVKNALGVGYLRLGKFQEANKTFEEALQIAGSDEDRACILSNLAEVMIYQENTESAKSYLEDALKLGVDDPLKQLVLQSNLATIDNLYKGNHVKEVANIKSLLKKEKSILGSNQFVGIFNYKTLGYICFQDGSMKKCEYYINKSLELNDNTYQYVTIEADLYEALSLIYTSYDFNKSIEYVNKGIEILENQKVYDNYDLLSLYVLRGNLYMKIDYPNVNLAIEDYEYVLEQCSPYHDLAAVSYYNLAYALEYLGDEDQVTESYARAYYIWNREGYEDSNQEIKKALRKIYEKQDDKDDDYESWFQTQIIQGKEDLSKLCKE